MRKKINEEAERHHGRTPNKNGNDIAENLHRINTKKYKINYDPDQKNY